MTNETNPGTVEACPFCDAAMSHCSDKDGEFWMHPGTVTDGDCFMSGQGIFLRQLTAWNTRAAQSQPAATVQEVGREVTKDVLASLVAALSILNRAHAEHKEPRKVVSSDAMFAQMLKDYEASVVRARAALTAEPAAKAGRPAVPSKNGFLSFWYKNYRGELSERVVIPVRIYHGSTEWHPDPQWLMEAWDMEKDAIRAFAMSDMQAPPSPQPDMGSGKDEVREQVARIISLAKGQPETGQTSIGAWWWDARHDRAKPDHFEGECREEDRKHADLMIPLLRAALSPSQSEKMLGLIERLLRTIESADADDIMSIEGWPIIGELRAALTPKGEAE